MIKGLLRDLVKVRQEVEMESLAAASAAALCIYDMCKPISKGKG